MHRTHDQPQLKAVYADIIHRHIDFTWNSTAACAQSEMPNMWCPGPLARFISTSAWRSMIGVTSIAMLRPAPLSHMLKSQNSICHRVVSIARDARKEILSRCARHTMNQPTKPPANIHLLKTPFVDRRNRSPCDIFAGPG